MSRLVKQILVVFGALFAVACSSDPEGTGSTDSSGSDPLQSCADFCFKYETAGCSNGGDCATDCKRWVDETFPRCEDELGAVLSCFVENAESCDDDPCSSLGEAYNTCQNM